MTIQEFITDHFKSRLAACSCLVIYDAEGRYRECAAALASETCTVIDVKDSLIESREQAMEEWLKLATPAKNRSQRQLMVYVNAPRPESDTDKCGDPFQLFALAGVAFPEGDGESYQALCRRAKPDFAAQVEALFQAGPPDFETVNQIGAGKDWPRLRSLLGVESAVEILVSFLSPNETQMGKLDSDSTWQGEFRGFCADVLGYKFVTKGQKWASIAGELWRFILFSEFVFDLPVALPVAVRDVPHAGKPYEALVYAVCKNLRDSTQHYVRYMEQAETVAGDLKLEAAMRGVEDLGVLDTFAFEERSFLRVFVKSALSGELGKAQKLVAERTASIWVKHTNRQLAWTVAERALALMTKADDLDSEWGSAKKDVAGAVDFYSRRGYMLDTLQRSFEQALADCCEISTEELEELVDQARQKYQWFAEKMQSAFVEGVVKEGWPASGHPRNTQVFDRWVAPACKEHDKRIAFFMVDALRFELGVELEKLLTKEGVCSLTPVCAQLPTITAVGMAALMPEAEGNLRLSKEGDKLVPSIKGRSIVWPKDRLDYIRSIYGDKCQMMDLDELTSLNVSPRRKAAIPNTVSLLLVKTTDIDEIGEKNPAMARKLIPTALKEIYAGLGKLKKLGFDEAVIATDHGFVSLPGQDAGDSVPKPSGDWLQVKDRCMLGSGSANPHVAVFKGEEVGIPGDFVSYAVPRSFGTFSRRVPYFHEGLSLQECVLPVLALKMAKEEAPVPSIDVQIGYKGGKTTLVTTRLPMIDISIYSQNMFEQGEMELRLEARGKDPATSQERVVGEPASSEHVHPATGLVRVKPGQAIKVPIRLEEGFSGTFEVVAYDPETHVTWGDPLRLKANIME